MTTPTFTFRATIDSAGRPIVLAEGIGNPGADAHNQVTRHFRLDRHVDGSLTIWDSNSGWALDSETIAAVLDGVHSRTIAQFRRDLNSLSLAAVLLPEMIRIHPGVTGHEKIRLGVLIRDLPAQIADAKRTARVAGRRAA